MIFIVTIFLVLPAYGSSHGLVRPMTPGGSVNQPQWLSFPMNQLPLRPSRTEQPSPTTWTLEKGKAVSFLGDGCEPLNEATRTRRCKVELIDGPATLLTYSAGGARHWLELDNWPIAENSVVVLRSGYTQYCSHHGRCSYYRIKQIRTNSSPRSEGELIIRLEYESPNVYPHELTLQPREHDNSTS